MTNCLNCTAAKLSKWLSKGLSRLTKTETQSPIIYNLFPSKENKICPSKNITTPTTGNDIAIIIIIGRNIIIVNATHNFKIPNINFEKFIF